MRSLVNNRCPPNLENAFIAHNSATAGLASVCREDKMRILATVAFIDRRRSRVGDNARCNAARHLSI